MKLKIPVLFSQTDPRWANILLGFNTNKIYNIYNYGCLITVLAMIAKYYGEEVNPETINKKLKKIKGFTAGSGNYIWGSLARLYPGTEKHTKTSLPLNDKQIGEIRTALDSGYPVMVFIDYNPKTAKPDQHWVLFIDYNPKNENDFTIIDPIGGVEKSLKSYLGWWKPSARKSIEAYVIYKGKVPKKQEGFFVDEKVFGKLVGNSTKWDKIHSYLELNGNPDDTSFDDAQRVIAGYKSRGTDQEKRAVSAESELKNRIEQVARLKGQLLKEAGMRKTLNDQFKSAVKNYNDSGGVYEGRMEEMQGEINALAAEKGACQNKLSEAERERQEVKWLLIIWGKIREFINKSLTKILK